MDSYRDRLYISHRCKSFLPAVFSKVVESTMESNVPPPYYMSCDVSHGLFVAVAVPEYDYQKLVDMARGDGIDIEDHRDLCAMMADSLSEAMVHLNDIPEEGHTRTFAMNHDGVRLYVSVSHESDMKNLNEIILNVSV